MNDHEILVSVAIVAYKHATYIRQAIESVLAQKVNFKYEIVIGDDASNDGSAEIILEYKEKYPDIIVPIINEKNIGSSANGYNVSFHCRGKYIAALEADDFWCDINKLQLQVDLLEAHSEYSAIASNWCTVDHNGENPKIKMLAFQTNRVYHMRDYINKGYIIHGNTLLRRRDAIPLNSAKYQKVRNCVPTMGDVFARILLYDSGAIYVLPEVTLCHRDGRSDVTSFSSAQLNNAMKYTYMMETLIDNINEYFDGKYDFTKKICTRQASVYLDYRSGGIKLDIKEWHRFNKSLGVFYRLYTYDRICYFFVNRVIIRMARLVGRIKKGK